MRWLRLYDDVLDDPKVQQLPPTLFKHWVNLLCLASKTNPRGTLPSLDDIAFRLRVSAAKAGEIISTLQAFGLIDDDCQHLVMHGWNGRQRASDDVTERVRKHRAAKDETLQPRFMERLETPLETDTETDTEKTTTPLPPKGEQQQSSQLPKNTYLETIGTALPKVAAQFGSIHAQFTEGWLVNTLGQAATEVGPLPRDRLGKGLSLAADQIRRQVDAGDVKSPRAFAKKLIVTYLQEQRDGSPTPVPAINGHRPTVPARFRD